MTREMVLAMKMKGEGLGVTPSPTISANARIMLATALIYLVIQGPALRYAKLESTPELNDEISHVESSWALGGLVLAIFAFCAYLVLMVQQSDGDVKQDKVELAMKKEIGRPETTILGLVTPLLAQAKAQHGKSGRGTLLVDAAERKRLAGLLGPFFAKYDSDGDGSLGLSELQYLLSDLGEPISKKEAKEWMKKLDPNRSGSIHSSELLDAVLTYVREKTIQDAAKAPKSPAPLLEAEPSGSDDDEMEVPEDLQSLSPEQQQSAIKARAFGMMGLGTALVLIFSDPMVEVMSNVGERLSIPPFYISFVLAPLASNASELIASVSYARKKTQKTITVALAALEGAACMNNTFCLAIFMALIYFKQLAWKFTAETCAILLIQLIVGVVAMSKTMTRLTGYLVLCLFPLSIVFIATLEGMGLD